MRVYGVMRGCAGGTDSYLRLWSEHIDLSSKTCRYLVRNLHRAILSNEVCLWTLYLAAMVNETVFANTVIKLPVHKTERQSLPHLADIGFEGAKLAVGPLQRAMLQR